MIDRKGVGSIVTTALCNGVIVKPKVCCLCSREKRVVAHHEDYSKPLEVKWICHSCHLRLHSKRKKKDATVMAIRDRLSTILPLLHK